MSKEVQDRAFEPILYDEIVREGYRPSAQTSLWFRSAIKGKVQLASNLGHGIRVFFLSPIITKV